MNICKAIFDLSNHDSVHQTQLIRTLSIYDEFREKKEKVRFPSTHETTSDSEMYELLPC